MQVLKEVGAWLRVNGEAIYGAGSTPFGAELAGSGIRDDYFVYRRPTGWRFTTRPGTLYVHLFEWPARSRRIEGVGAKVTRARLLAEPNRNLTIKQEGTAVTVSLPAEAPGALANVVALDYNGDFKRQ